MTKSNFLKNVATIVACLAVMTACNSGGSKKQSGDTLEAKTETQAKIPKGKLEIVAEVPPLLTQYNLTADALKPVGAVSVEVAYGRKEDVYFLLAKGTELNLKADFTKMLDAIKVATDDGKIYNYLTDDMEFDPAMVDGYSLGHRVKYICKGKSVQIYLSYSYNYKPVDKNSPPAYGILFNYGQGQ